MEARTLVEVMRAKLDARFFNPTDTSKIWLHNEAVLGATVFSPGGGAMLKKISAGVGREGRTPPTAPPC